MKSKLILLFSVFFFGFIHGAGAGLTIACDAAKAAASSSLAQGAQATQAAAFRQAAHSAIFTASTVQNPLRTAVTYGLKKGLLCSHPMAQKYIKWQKAGKRQKMIAESERLQAQIDKMWFLPMRKEHSQLVALKEILDQPITQELAIIANGTFEEAMQAIKRIRRLSPFKHHPEMTGSVSTKEHYRIRLEAHLQDMGCNQLDEAETLFEARSDYQEKMGPTLRTTLRHGEAPREFGFAGGKAPDGSSHVLENVTLGSPIAEQLTEQSNVPIGKHEDVTDMVTTTATDAALVQEYLAQSVKDRGARLDQLHELLSAAAQTGAMTAERCVSITHAFLEGALVDPLVATVDTVLHPIQAAQNIAEGAMKLADEIGPFMIDVFSAPDAEFPTAADMQAHRERLQARAESMSKTYAACMEHIAGLTPEQKARLVGNITGQILLGKYGPQVAGKAAGGGVSFVGTALNETPFLQEFMGQLSRGAQVALPEGVAVSMPAAKTAAEIAADAKAAAEAAQAVAQGASAASAASNAGSVLRQDNQKTTGGGDSSVAKYSFKNGRYEDASYHSAKGNSVKSAKPIDGQHALDNSLPLPRNTERRVAVSNNQIVILDKTVDGLYHGHVRTWKNLNNDVIEAVLRKAGLVTKRGKIKQ